MTALAGPTEARVPTAAAGGGGRIQHLPALDGLRGLAVVAVLLYHGELDRAQGGWLGVSVFFTLSGFLITSLLLAEWRDTGTVSLRAFWGRRFRRLLPASLVCLLLIAAYGWLLASPEQLQRLRGDLLGALGYVANWRFLLRDSSYAELFSDPSPVQHFWSLAIEEQFYLAYPLVVVGLLRAGGRRALGVVLSLAAAGSVLVGLLLRTDLDRVYYGTDTRMAELLVGGLVALWWTRRGVAGRTEPAGPVQVLVGAAVLLASVALWVLVPEDSRWVTRGVLPLQALLSAAIVVLAATRTGGISSLLGRRALTAVGTISYGLYLYHWPIFLALDEDRTGLDGAALFAVRIASTVVAALLSYLLVEQPIRRRHVLVRAPSARLALAGGVAVTLLAAILVTWSPPPSRIAHAGADLAAGEARVRVLSEAPVPVGVPATVMVVGDSGTYDLAPAVGAAFQHLGAGTFVDHTQPGFGLTRPETPWKDGWAEVVEANDPRLVVAMLGGWDADYLDRHGPTAYDAVIDEAIEVLTRRGARVLWLGMLDGPGTDTEVMDGRFRAAARRHPGVVAFADVGAAVAAPDGTFPRRIPVPGGRALARKPDGWHLCPDGAALLARAVVGEAAAAGWSPPPVPGWERGAWRELPRYDDPPGGCDDGG